MNCRSRQDDRMFHSFGNNMDASAEQPGRPDEVSGLLGKPHHELHVNNEEGCIVVSEKRHKTVRVSGERSDFEQGKGVRFSCLVKRGKSHRLSIDIYKQGTWLQGKAGISHGYVERRKQAVHAI